MSFPKGFAGTEHYRERAKATNEWLDTQEFLGFERQLAALVNEQCDDVNALCDHVEEQDKEIDRLREALWRIKAGALCVEADGTYVQAHRVASDALKPSRRTESSEK